MSSLDGEDNFALDDSGLNGGHGPDVAKEIDDFSELLLADVLARDEFGLSPTLVWVCPECQEVHLLVTGKTGTDDFLEAGVQVGDGFLGMQVLEGLVKFVDKLFFLEDNVLATELLKSEQDDGVCVEGWLHDLAEEVEKTVSLLGSDGHELCRVLVQRDYLILSEILQASDESGLVEFVVVQVLVVDKRPEESGLFEHFVYVK